MTAQNHYITPIVTITTTLGFIVGMSLHACVVRDDKPADTTLLDRVKKLEDNLQDNSSKDFSGRWDDREKLRSLDTRLRVLESEQKKESEQEEHEEYQEDFDKQFPPSYFLEQKRKKAQ